MSDDIKKDAARIIDRAIGAVLPDESVRRAIAQMPMPAGRIVLVAVGKAAWRMAHAAHEVLGAHISSGTVITKYGHSEGSIGDFAIYEAGHPMPDERSIIATKAALSSVDDLSSDDLVLFLLSGGGSSLFELPRIDLDDLVRMDRELLSSGADIVEINTLRKRMSWVKGGRFALRCAPARVFSIVLSDVIGDPLDMIASGPTVADTSTCSDAQAVVSRYGITMSDEMMRCLTEETPKEITNTRSVVTGSVRELCEAAKRECEALDHETIILTDRLCCEASEAGIFLSNIARYHSGSDRSKAFIAGGETVVHVKGGGRGGRNQELALSAARGIIGLDGTVIFSVGSDGTDGPTDAAGAIVDGHSAARLERAGHDIRDVLARHDSYPALESIDALIKTGPTGTNVNDLSVVLIRR